MLGLDGTRVLHACRKFYSEVQEDIIIMSEKKSEIISMIISRMQRTGEKSAATSGYCQYGNSGGRVELAPRMNGVWKVLTMQE